MPDFKNHKSRLFVVGEKPLKNRIKGLMGLLGEFFLAFLMVGFFRYQLGYQTTTQEVLSTSLGVITGMVLYKGLKKSYQYAKKKNQFKLK